jgi:hypothetical protein
LPQPDSDGVYIEILEGNEKSLGYIAAIDYLTIDDSRRLRRQVQTLNNNKSEIDTSVSNISFFRVLSIRKYRKTRREA